ncbi:MAG: hypothetical protein QMC95_18315 [Desulfitobacteriaceae bacterium]|nr:hypothetical protein [Desulfitobacteriaceae bacterium]MDI6916129.1 hypothetical protein [Desulfitobacteriaceae bacterium]
MQQQQQTLAPHETLELHELLRSQMAGVKKLESSLSMIQDQDLAALVQADVQTKKQQLRDIQQFVNSHNLIQ